MSVFYDENDTWGVTVCRIVGGLIGAFIAVAVGKELGENGRWVYRIGCIIGAGIGGAIGGAIGSGVKSISSRADDKKTTGDNATPAEVIFVCPHCGQNKTVSREFIGLHTRCPRCQQTYSTADARNRFFRVSAAEDHQYRHMHGGDKSDPFVVLGIPCTLSVQEKKRKLRELFAKWNSLQTHKDPEMRRKAEKIRRVLLC